MQLGFQHGRPCVSTHHRLSHRRRCVLALASKTSKGSTQQLTRKGTVKAKTVGKDRLADADDEGRPSASLSSALGSRFYTFITGFPFPLGPAFVRDTIRREVEKDTIWVFEQTQALENVSVYTPVRMTVIRLKSGGLWVHAPVAPTGECVRLVKELGNVEYIVLTTFAYEHKAFVGPFSRKFPKAKVYVTPYQWSFPLNLPSQFFGIFPAGELALTEEGMPWADEIAQRMLLPPSIGIGEYARQGECAFLHRASRTLLVTDAVMYVDDNVPEIIPKDALLESARDSWLNRFRAGKRTAAEVKAIARPEPREDTLENRIRGWRRMCLLVLFFNPSNLLEPDPSFEAFSNRLVVPPVVETLVYTKFKAAVRSWVDSISSEWSFNRVIPAHFCAPVRTTPADFKRAFAFAYEGEDAGTSSSPQPASAMPGSDAGGFLASLLGSLQGIGARAQSAKLTRPATFLDDDIKTLRDINWLLLRSGVVREVS